MEPIRGGVEAGLRLGLGKQEQENFYMAAENVTRKRLETEVQGDEDEGRTQRREVRAPNAENGPVLRHERCVKATMPLFPCMLPLTLHGRADDNAMLGEHGCT